MDGFTDMAENDKSNDSVSLVDVRYCTSRSGQNFNYLLRTQFIPSDGDVDMLMRFSGDGPFKYRLGITSDFQDLKYEDSISGVTSSCQSGIFRCTLLPASFISRDLYSPHALFYPVIEDELNGLSYSLERFRYVVVPDMFHTYLKLKDVFLYSLGFPELESDEVDAGNPSSIGIRVVLESYLDYLAFPGVEQIEAIVNIAAEDSNDVMFSRRIWLTEIQPSRYMYAGPLFGEDRDSFLFSPMRLNQGEQYKITLEIWGKPLAWRLFKAAGTMSLWEESSQSFVFCPEIGKNIGPDGRAAPDGIRDCLEDVNKVRVGRDMSVITAQEDEEEDFDSAEEKDIGRISDKDEFERLLDSFINESGDPGGSETESLLKGMRLYEDDEGLVADNPLPPMIHYRAGTDLQALLIFDVGNFAEIPDVTVRAINLRTRVEIECEMRLLPESANGDWLAYSLCFTVPCHLIFNHDKNIPLEKLKVEVRETSTNVLISEFRYTLVHARSASDILKVSRMVFIGLSEDASLMSQDFTQSCVAFKHDDLRKLAATCVLELKNNCELDGLSPSFGIHDASGRLVETQDPQYMSRDGSSCIVTCGFGKFCNYSWEKGKYRVEFSIMDLTVASCLIEVGDRSLEGELDVTRRVLPTVRQTLKGSAFLELDGLIGLEKVKEQIRSFETLQSLSRKRKEAGLPVRNPVLHSIFLGNPGTGKTTVAKIMGSIFHEMGLLSSGHVVVTARKNLVGRYYDSELRAIEEAIEQAKGGVLFIDEAYSLYVKDDTKDPGHKIIESLLTHLSDDGTRDFMLIMAGYRDKMTDMMNSNPGLESRIPNRYIFEDYSVEELVMIAERYCRINGFRLTSGALSRISAQISRDYVSKDDNFGNARYVENLLEKQVLVRMSQRLRLVVDPTRDDLVCILEEDVPVVGDGRKLEDGFSVLEDMVGLDTLKRSIFIHLNYVKMMNLRVKAGLHASMPPLHMIFTGNPGTGKTTVADLMGEIYASMGLLSCGEVVKVEKKDLVGSYRGETERKMRSVLNQARGNILFIDEAYQLYEPSGYGSDVLDSLLTTLSKDGLDMIVILAGYTKDMERLLDMNEGLRSRFPYTFHFNDYSVDELVEIGLRKVKKENFVFSPKALERFRALILKESMDRHSSFGNGRFVVRLISSRIIPAMANRVAAIKGTPTAKQLKTIYPSDIPISAKEAERVLKGTFDEEAIDSALARLDSLVGQKMVKAVLHNFVKLCRFRHSVGEPLLETGMLKWSFVGNTGTGKSTVARILAEILNAMNLLKSSKMEEIKGETIFSIPENKCDELLRSAMLKSRSGMLFIDGDAPELKIYGYSLSSEQLRFKLSSLTAETGGPGAMVIAEYAAPRKQMMEGLPVSSMSYGGTLVFEDFSEDELFQILVGCISRYRLKFSAEAEQKIRKYISGLCSCRELGFANARTMNDLSRVINEKLQLRNANGKSFSKQTVEMEDVADFECSNKPRSGKIGF